MTGRAAAEAAFPGEPVRFEATPVPGLPGAEVEWSGGGTPARGRGARFTTVFDAGGAYTVTARSKEASLTFPVTVCPVDAWLSEARAFFGPSIDLDRVVVKTSRFVLGRVGTAWTCNRVIRFTRVRRTTDLPDQATLVHELGHVWEHQTGQAQLIGGIVEQIGRWVGRRDPYDYGGPAGLRAAPTLAGLSKEGQAQVIAELWKAEHGRPVDRLGVPFATPGYVEDLRRLVGDAGIGHHRVVRAGTVGGIDRALAWIVNALLGV
jgi:hypothetical protein